MAFELGAPAGWRWMSLADLSLGNTITYGVVQPGADDPHGVPMIRVNNFTANGLDLSNLAHIAPNIEAKYTRTRLRHHDVLITVVGSVGQVAIVPAEAVNWNIARAVALIRPADIKLSRWIALCLRSPSSQHSLNVTANTTVQTTVNLKELKQLAIPMPPTREREEIAATLSALDDRIELLRQTNATLESIAQTLFKSWFVDFDPVHAKTEDCEPDGMDTATAALFPDSFEDSPLGPIPQGWGVGSLSTYSDLNALSWSNRNHPATLRYLDLSNVKDNRIDTVSDYLFADAPSRARRVLRSGDTIVGTVRPGNRSFAYVAGADAALTGSTGFAVLSPKATTTREFVYLAATCDSNIERLANLADGGAYPAVRPELVSATTIVLPTDPVLNAFSSIASALFAKQSYSSAMQRSLSELRDTLLPRLISGKLRLPEAQTLIDEATP